VEQGRRSPTFRLSEQQQAESQSSLFLSAMADRLSNSNNESTGHPSRKTTCSTSLLRRQNSSFASFSATQPHSKSKHTDNPAFSKVFAVLIVLVGMVASASILVVGIRGANQDARETFENESHELVISIANAWQDYETYALWIHESCHLTHAHNSLPIEQNVALHMGFCSRDKFRRLYEYIKNLGLDFVAMQFLPNVTHAQRAPLEEAALAYYEEKYPKVAEVYQGIKAVQVTNGAVTGIGVSPPKPFYFPIHYIMPLENNERAVDVDTIPGDIGPLEKSLRTGIPYVADRFQTIQDSGTSLWSVSLMHPGIRTSVDEEYAEKGQSPNNAVAKIIIRVADLVKRASNYAGMVPGMSVYVYDVSDEHLLQAPPGTSAIFLAGANVAGVNQLELREEIRFEDIPRTNQDLFYTERIAVADKEWLVVATPYDDSIYGTELTYVILGATIIFAACLALAVWFYFYLRRVSRLSQMKHDSQAEKAQIAVKQVQRERHLNDFIAHEVRNPLSSAIVALSFVSETTRENVHSDRTRRSLLEDIGILENSLNYINDLLRNMLDIHRTKNKQIMLKCEPTNLRKDILEPCSAILCLRGAKANMVEVQVESVPQDLCVDVDRLRLQQVVLNLAMNSTKFVESGFIRLGCVSVVDDIKGEEHVILYVEDSGPGIPLSKREHLFEKYQESLDLLNQGTGIGLYICKHLSDIMGAEIRLDESYDSGVQDQPGTRFVIDLKKPPLPLAHDDDDPEHVALLARPPQEESDSARTMPTSSESSINSTTQVTSKSTTTPELPPGDVQEDLVETSPFLHVVDEIPLSLSSKDKNPAIASGTLQPEGIKLPEKLSVLFVDDDATLRKLFVRAVKRVAPKWQVDQAPNGETSIELTMGAAKDHYGIIFMDQYMASTEKQLLGTDTIQVLRRNGVRCLICGLSANDHEDKFRRAGADDFILKPFPCEKSALQKELLRVLNVQRARSQATSTNNDTAMGESSISSSPVMPV